MDVLEKEAIFVGTDSVENTFVGNVSFRHGTYGTTIIGAMCDGA
jgi:hypothetical protein